MDVKRFYFLSEQYFLDFEDPYLMKNKEVMDGKERNRPCFYSFTDNISGVYWMIPISSKLEKYRKIQLSKINKYGRCDTIIFGNIFNKERAFLIQNMCPVTENYVLSEYLDIYDRPIYVDNVFADKLIKIAKNVLAMERRGRKLILPDVLEIEKILMG